MTESYMQHLSQWSISLIVLILFYIFSAGFLGILAYGAYAAGIISLNSFNFVLETEVLLSLSIAIFLYSKFYRRESIGTTLRSLGLSKESISLNAAWIGFLLFVTILLFEIAVSAFEGFSNITINTNASVLFTGAPLWFYIFTAVIEPINEEIVFRGFLIDRINLISNTTISRFLRSGYDSNWIGIVVSAVIFGLLHASYDSTFAIEVIAAMFFGLLAGYVFKKSGSLYPSIITHILVNSLAVSALLVIMWR